MTKDDFRVMLDAMAVGWTNREYDAVASYFNDELFYSDPLHYAFSNKRDLLAFFRDDNGMPQGCEFHDAVFDEERQIGAAEYTYEGTHRYHGTVWIEMLGGKISSWREYQHVSELDQAEFWKNR